jgi:hypothetical protein
MDRQLRRCREKSDNYNFFRSKKAAKLAAKRTTKRSGKLVVHYHCPICGGWHMGKRYQEREMAWIFDFKGIDPEGKYLVCPIESGPQHPGGYGLKQPLGVFRGRELWDYDGRLYAAVKLPPITSAELEKAATHVESN